MIPSIIFIQSKIIVKLPWRKDFRLLTNPSEKKKEHKRRLNSQSLIFFFSFVLNFDLAIQLSDNNGFAFCATIDETTLKILYRIFAKVSWKG